MKIYIFNFIFSSLLYLNRTIKSPWNWFLMQGYTCSLFFNFLRGKPLVISVFNICELENKPYEKVIFFLCSTLQMKYLSFECTHTCIITFSVKKAFKIAWLDISSFRNTWEIQLHFFVSCTKGSQFTEKQYCKVFFKPANSESP